MLDFIDRSVIPFFLSLYDAVGYLGVGIAIGLETFVPIIPSEVIVPMAGWKVSQSAADPSVLEPLTHAPWSWLVVLVIATVGAVAGSFAGYLIGAWGGRPLLDRWGRYVHIRPDDLDRADAWFARYGDRAVFLARLVPLLRALINYPAGVARMPVGRFLLFSALGSLPWNAALLLGGYLLGENYRRLYDAIRPYELLIYAVVLVGIAYVIYRWLRGRGDSRPSGGRIAASELRERFPSLERAVRSLTRDELARFVVAVRESATTDHLWPADHRFWFDGSADLKFSRAENHVIRELWTRLNAALVFAITGEEVEERIDAPSSWIARLDNTGPRSQLIEGHAASILENDLGGDIWLGTTGIWNALCAELLRERLEPALRDDLATSWSRVRPSHPISLAVS